MAGLNDGTGEATVATVTTPLPWITSILIGLSIVGTGLWVFAPQHAYGVLHATNLEIWMKYKWWCLLTSLFPHSGLPHLFFNSYWTWHLGRLLERDLGELRFLGLVVITTWFGSVAELAIMGDVGIGMSGMVYGLFGYMLVNRRRVPEYAALLSNQNIVIMLGWLVLCFVTTSAGLMNIANFAHLGGLLAGIGGGFAWPAGPGRPRAVGALLAAGVVSVVTLFWAPWLDEWHYVGAFRAIRAGDQESALYSLARVRRAVPESEWAARAEAQIRNQRGEHTEAREVLLPLADLSTTGPALRNDLAWLLATCPDDSVRDGAKAVELAQDACDATEWKNAYYLDTLAAAYAELGNFEAAVKWSEKSMEFAGAEKAQLARHRENFSAGRPWRESPRKSR